MFKMTCVTKQPLPLLSYFLVETTKKDVAPFCEDLLALLAHAKRKDQRMTALKLLDAWMGKGSPALRLATTRAHNLPRGDCERVIVELLLRGCLKEDFHFTPYSTISYLVPGVYVTHPTAPLAI